MLPKKQLELHFHVPNVRSFAIIIIQARIEYGLEILFRVVKDKRNENFNLKWSNAEAIKVCNDNFVNNTPNGRIMRGVFEVFDGGRLPCADYEDPVLQNEYYN